MRVGAYYQEKDRCEFRVWAPRAEEISVRLVSPEQRLIPMERSESGYWESVATGVSPGATYLYVIDGTRERPDPASFFQPLGIHQASEVIDHAAFSWQDRLWGGLPPEKMIIYELHVGTFTPEGTFRGVIDRLDDLLDLGVTALELMPVAQFPGERNWGYDGVHPYAVQNSYGGPRGLKELVDAAHRTGMAVVLDVVYNHLGPEGNYLGDFGPYFTTKYLTPWGSAVNFDGAYNDEVRNFFIENALYWFRHFHIDALRIDAIHGIVDNSAKPFLQELAERVDEYSGEQGRRHYLIAESDLNDERVIRPRGGGGFGFDAQWLDDFHHAVHCLLTGEGRGYYQDFGRIEHLAKALREGFVYSWDYSQYRKRRHGSSSRDRPASQFVAFTQNHDQVGNRMRGERLSRLVGFEAEKLTAGVLLLSPYIPLLFMGQEYGEDAPFCYFVSYGDEHLARAVRDGRKQEFASFGWEEEPPDPQSTDTFRMSTICWEKRGEGRHAVLLNLYRTLIRLRKEVPALSFLSKESIHLRVRTEGEHLLSLWRQNGESEVFIVMNFGDQGVRYAPPLGRGRWERCIDSSDEEWLGPGSELPATIATGTEVVVRPYSFALFVGEGGE